MLVGLGGGVVVVVVGCGVVCEWWGCGVMVTRGRTSRDGRCEPECDSV